jgi:meso-butanediol dehydrogenase/(S,S)-butanediol dehydrogenase/diacetyl reductase
MQILYNKVVFITGGTEGIGFECAKAYHKAGAKLSIISNNIESMEKASRDFSGSDIHYIFANVSVAEDIKNAIAETVNRFGKIDVIHNNAGIASPAKTLCDTTDDEFNNAFNVNVKGIYHTVKYGIAELKKSRGNILNTTSLVAQIGQEIHAVYTATKGAVDSLTKSMALDYATFGIRVNAVAPAGVWTPMLREWNKLQPNVEQMKRYLDNIHVLGYCPEGDVVADACLFLISEQARFITGCILPVTGGAELGYRHLPDIQHTGFEIDG